MRSINNGNAVIYIHHARIIQIRSRWFYLFQYDENDRKIIAEK